MRGANHPCTDIVAEQIAETRLLRVDSVRMDQLINIVIVIVSILLMLCILLQHRASGLSSTFGGTGATYVQRRGAERLIYQAAIWLSVIFFLIPVVQWYV